MSGIVNSTGARSGVIGTTVGTPAAGGITEAESQDIFIIKPYSGQRINYNDIKKIESGDIIYIVEKIKYDKRTKLQDVVMITNGITSTLSFILTLMVVMGGVN